MGVTVEARYKGRYLILDQSLSLPEGQRVRVTIEPIDEVTVGQRIVDQWRAAGVIGVWEERSKTLSSAQWARRLRKKTSQRTR